MSCTDPPKKTHHFILIYNSVFDDIGYSYLRVRLDPSVTSDPTDTSSRGLTPESKSGEGKTGC